MNLRDKDIQFGSLDQENEDIIDQYNSLVDEYQAKIDQIEELMADKKDMKVQYDTLAEEKAVLLE
jgi:hypothetical protein